MTNVGSLSKTIMAAQTGQIEIARKDALREELPTHIVDTCYCVDTEQWETGVKPKDKVWIIVEQYKNKEKATIGHKNWVEKLKKTPTMKLKNVLEVGF